MFTAAVSLLDQRSSTCCHGSFLSGFYHLSQNIPTAYQHQLSQPCMRSEQSWRVLLRSEDTPRIRLLPVGVLISKLHPCTRCRKSSFTERSFTIAWLSVQFPEVPKVRVNSLICFSHVFFHCSVDWFLRFHPLFWNPDIQAQLWMQRTEFWNWFCVFNLGKPGRVYLKTTDPP